MTAEVFLRPETDPASLREQAALLTDHVDAILLTDNQYGQLHLSTIAAASILLDAGIDPVVQLTCRNRNRIALISELLGAAAIGVTSLLLVAGEKAPKEFRPRPKPVLDLAAVDLIRTAAKLKTDERLTYCPDFFVGGLVTPVLPGAKWKAVKLTEKIEAGAQFVQTHICMDVPLLKRYLGHLVKNRLIRRTSVIGAITILESADDAKWVRDNRPNVMIPDEIIERLEQADDPQAEGIRIGAETLQAMREIPGMVGATISATRNLKSIAEVIRAAGVS